MVIHTLVEDGGEVDGQRRYITGCQWSRGRKIYQREDGRMTTTYEMSRRLMRNVQGDKQQQL